MITDFFTNDKKLHLFVFSITFYTAWAIYRISLETFFGPSPRQTNLEKAFNTVMFTGVSVATCKYMKYVAKVVQARILTFWTFLNFPLNLIWHFNWHIHSWCYLYWATRVSLPLVAVSVFSYQCSNLSNPQSFCVLINFPISFAQLFLLFLLKIVIQCELFRALTLYVRQLERHSALATPKLCYYETSEGWRPSRNWSNSRKWAD